MLFTLAAAKPCLNIVSCEFCSPNSRTPDHAVYSEISQCKSWSDRVNLRGVFNAGLLAYFEEYLAETEKLLVTTTNGASTST